MNNTQCSERSQGTSFSHNVFGMVGMCYGQGRKTFQRDGVSYDSAMDTRAVQICKMDSVSETSARKILSSSVQTLSSSFLCLGPRPSKKGGRLKLGSDENIPENAPGPQTLPPRLLTDSVIRDADGESDDAFSDARSTIALSQASQCDSRYSKRSKRSSRRSHRTARLSRAASSQGYMTPMSINETGYQTPISDIIQSTLASLEDKRRSVNCILDGGFSGDYKELLLELSEVLLETAKICVKEPASRDCNLVYDTTGLKVWKKEFGIGRLLVRGEFIAPVTAKQYIEFASNQAHRKSWDSNVEHVSNIENIGHKTDICYTATKRVATIFPRDTVVLRIVRSIEGTNGEESHVSCNCSVQHPAMPEKPGKVRATMHIGCYIAIPYTTPFGEWCVVKMFHDGDPKGWIPSSVTKMIATKVFPRSVEKVLKSVMLHCGINWMETGCSTATDYATHMLSKHSIIRESISETLDDIVECDQAQPPRSPAGSVLDLGYNIPVGESIAPNMWKVQ